MAGRTIRAGLICLALVLLGPTIAWLEAQDLLVLSESTRQFLESFHVQIYFVSLPGWFVAAVLYVVLSKFYQRPTPTTK